LVVVDDVFGLKEYALRTALIYILFLP